MKPHRPDRRSADNQGKSSAGRLSPAQIIIKRLFDILLSIFSIVVTLPLSVIFSLIIIIGGKGEVIYRQERVGLGGKPFMLYKFRTMKRDAESNGPMLSEANDTRVTPFGRFLRRHKLDEIPNFINVLFGEMSIVGPRPEREYYLEKMKEIDPEASLLTEIKPGITCYGQTEYGYAASIEQMIERLPYELEYVKNPSLSADIKIVLKTAQVLLTGKTARAKDGSGKRVPLPKSDTERAVSELSVTPDSHLQRPHYLAD